MYRLAALLVAAFCVAHVASQCARYSGRVWFLLDVSETARTESTTNLDVQPPSLRYDILRSQLQQFAGGLSNTDRPTDVALGVVSYQGSARQTLPLTQPADLLRLLNNQAQNGIIPDNDLTQGGVSTGGSWTYTGLELLANQASQLVERDTNNVIVIVSAQASFNAQRQSRAVTAAQRLRAAGFEVYVVGVKESAQTGFLDETELRAVAGINPPTSSDPNDPSRYNRIDSYTQLSSHLNTEVRDKRLCVNAAPTAPPTTTTTADPNHPCARCMHYSGTYNVPHPDTCSKFYQCRGLDPVTGDYLFSIFDCGPGTLFNDTDGNCVWPKDMSCPAWGRCTLGRVEQFPHLCCGKYWRCANGLMDELDCPSGQVYRDGQCRAVSDSLCLSQSPCPAGEFVKCDYKPVPENPCLYNNYDPISKKDNIMECPFSKGWNQEECACSMDVTSCPMEEGVDVLNGNDGIDCKSHMHMSFDENFRAIDEEKRTDSGNWIASNGVTLKEGSYAQFNGREGKENDIVFIPYYANRAFPDKFAIRLQFRFHNDAPESEYVLIANDRCAECIATLRVTASRSSSSSNQWTFTFWVKDAEGGEASVSATVNINDNQAWSEVKVVVDKNKISGTVSTPGGGASNQQEMTGTDSTITGKVKETDCGLSIGQGRIGPETSKQTVALDGDVNDFKFYECADLTNLN